MLHHIRLGFFHAQRQRGKHIRAEIDRQDLPHTQRQRHERETCLDDKRHQFRNVARKNICDELADIIVYRRVPLQSRSVIAPKSSWVKIISAASFATSVPTMPIEIPISALRKAGASFTPSPVTATTSPRCWKAETSLILCSGAMRANNTSLSSNSCKATSDNSSNSAPVKMIGILRGQHSHTPRQRLGSQSIIAGDHHNTNICFTTGLNCFFHLRPGRIHHRHQAQECQILFDALGCISAGTRRQVTPRQSQHAQGTACIIIIDRQNFSPH